MTIDWSKSPKDATHARKTTVGQYFYKLVNDQWHYWGGQGWEVAIMAYDLVDRPKTASVDWSKAPEGATHYCEGSVDNTHWRDLSGENARYWFNDRWNDHGLSSAHCLASNVRYIARPAWNGEGLPPVGKSVCEYLGANQYDEWSVVNIFAHLDNIVFVEYGNGWRAERDISRFRPIRTAEQIAEDEREAGIREIATLMAVGGGFKEPCADDLRDAAAVWDAGYRKRVAP